MAAGFRVTQRQVTGTYLSLRDYLVSAFGLKVYQIVAPDWLATTRFDIAATLPDGATQEQVPPCSKRC